MKRHLALLAMCLCLFAQAAAAQESAAKSFGVVLYAEGDDLTVYRDKVLKTYAVAGGTVIGLKLMPGDLVQTGPGTFIEIQLAPSKSIIKVAENTSFRITGLGSDKGSTIDVVYGRIRAKVDSLLGAGGFAIRGQTAVAGVRGTEFGYDVIAAPGIGDEPSSRIYCFSGKIKVATLQAGELNAAAQTAPVDNAVLDKAKAFELQPGQMMAVYDAADDTTRAKIPLDGAEDTLVAAGSRTVVLSKAIKAPIKSYWKKHEIQSGEAETAAALAKAPEAQPESDGNLANLINPLPSFDPLTAIGPKQYALQRDNDKAAGMVMLGIGLAADVFGIVAYAYGTDLGMSRADSQMTGIACMSSGVFLNITGIIGFISGMNR